MIKKADLATENIKLIPSYPDPESLRVKTQGICGTLGTNSVHQQYLSGPEDYVYFEGVNGEKYAIQVMGHYDDDAE